MVQGFRSPPHGRREHLVLGATVRTLGAWPAGWRYQGAHRDPTEDARELTRIAVAAERAHLQFLYFGDWLATSLDFELTDPYLLARIEPLTAISHLAAVTERIGLVATISSAHSEPFSAARATASVDLLSAGRAALAITTGSESRSASNFGWQTVHRDADRVASAGEFIQVLRGLWDSWSDDAFVADARTGVLVDPEALHTLNYVGSYRSSMGPLNVVRPPQGHPPIAVVASAENLRELAARAADLAFVSPRTLEEGVQAYATAKRLASELGRDPAQYLLLTTVFPIVAETREDAWNLYDELVELVQVETVSGRSTVDNLPASRTLRHLAGVLGVSLTGVSIDEVVPARLAARFGDLGRSLVEVVGARSGRTVGGHRGVTLRHLLVAHAVVAPIIVGSAEDIADHFESWFRKGAVDGFTVLSAFTEQFEAFTTLVVPELVRRGLFPADYLGNSLREHLGLSRPVNRHARKEESLEAGARPVRRLHPAETGRRRS